MILDVGDSLVPPRSSPFSYSVIEARDPKVRGHTKDALLHAEGPTARSGREKMRKGLN